MFTSKERSNLRAIAQNISPVTQIGKGGISENLIKSLSEALEARELIKVSVLNNNDDDPKQIALELEPLICLITYLFVSLVVYEVYSINQLTSSQGISINDILIDSCNLQAWYNS